MVRSASGSNVVILKAGRDAAYNEVVAIAARVKAGRNGQTDYEIGYKRGAHDAAYGILLDAQAAVEAAK